MRFMSTKYKTIQELLGNLYVKLEPEDLDELVHEVYSGYATAVNNAGTDDQLEFLRQELGDSALLDCVKELTEGR